MTQFLITCIKYQVSYSNNPTVNLQLGIFYEYQTLEQRKIFYFLDLEEVSTSHPKSFFSSKLELKLRNRNPAAFIQALRITVTWMSENLQQRDHGRLGITA